MNTGLFKIETNHVNPKKGRILVAEPFLTGSYFNRAVVLLVSHNEFGSVGFILNKKVAYSLNEVIKNFPAINSEVFIGGPVNSDSLYYIHTLGKDLPGSIKINDNLYWGGDIGKLKYKISIGVVHPWQIRFFLGYSGWDKGQLEEEKKENLWLVSDIDDKNILAYSTQKQMWTLAVRKIGGKYSLWVNYPEDPSLN